MIIRSMDIRQFRNYEDLSITFHENTNILYGKNAQGKTNLLEAAYISSTSRSHRAAKDKELIKFGCDEAHVRTIVEKDDGSYRIDIHLKQGKAKGIAVNGVPLKKSADLFGILQVILFSPEDLDIVKRGPQERRRFLDVELCQIDRLYLNDLTVYKKALNHRNRLLKDIGYDSSLIDTLSVWDEKLLYHGKRIIKRRETFIDELIEKASSNYKKITSDTEDMQVFYEPNVSCEEFENKLSENRNKDIRFGQTHSGPHRDDMGFSIHGMDVRSFGSQGQQRSCALSLKLSEIEIMEEHTGQKPVLLLDDVLSELDSDRQRELLKSLLAVQTIMTCTGMDEILENGVNADRVFIVENAAVRQMQ